MHRTQRTTDVVKAEAALSQDDELGTWQLPAAVAVKPRRPAVQLRRGFISGVFALVSVFAAAGATIPLFNVYRTEEGFTNAGTSLTVVAYSAATLGALLVLGRLSGFVGRRPVAITSLGLILDPSPRASSPPSCST